VRAGEEDCKAAAALTRSPDRPVAAIYDLALVPVESIHLFFLSLHVYGRESARVDNIYLIYRQRATRTFHLALSPCLSLSLSLSLFQKKRKQKENKKKTNIPQDFQKGYSLFLALPRACVPESFGERIVVNFQLRYLQWKSQLALLIF
jgi:hypothetical protein